MSLADAIVPPPWSDYSMRLCIAVIVLAGLITLAVVIFQKPSTDTTDYEEQ